MGTRSGDTGGGNAGRTDEKDDKGTARPGGAGAGAGKGGTLSVAQAERAVGKLASAGPGQVETGFKTDANQPRLDGVKNQLGVANPRTVQLATLYATTPAVSQAAVVKALSTASGTKSAAGSNTANTPVVARVKGKNYIVSGHEILAAARLKGKKTAKVKFLDLDGTSNV